MIRLPDIAGKAYAVMGLGASGLVAAEALAASGARVRAWDDTAEARESAAARGIPLADFAADGLAGADALVLSPGIPHSFPAPHPAAARAASEGVPIICDVELLLRAQGDARFLGVTGTNGKSTVTALLGHIFEAAGLSAAVGGNLGPAALGLPELGRGGTYILELSSYQIERLRSAAFDIAVLINISPDHLDRHGGIDGYVAAKESLFALTRPGAVAVIGADDAQCRALSARLAARDDLRVVPISGAGAIAGGVGVADGQVMDATGSERRTIADIRSVPTLPGWHNHQNAAAATAAALAAGIGPDVIARALVTYPGLAHRQETIRRIGAVTYINDSKATNPDAAARALACYDRVYWIAGGRAKDGGFEALDVVLPRIAHAFLIGEAAGAIARALEGTVAQTQCGTLDAALGAAHEAAQRFGGEAVVLLSPACASFDQFSNFAARGDAFRRAVMALGEAGR